MADNIDVDRVIEEMEAVPQTRERRMILALAKELKAIKSAGAVGGGKTKAKSANQGDDQGQHQR